MSAANRLGRVVVGLALSLLVVPATADPITLINYLIYSSVGFVLLAAGLAIWATVTGVLIAVFTGLVVGLQGILADVTQGQTLAFATSTLAKLAMPQAIRSRGQGFIDRRFNRSHYDAGRTVEAVEPSPSDVWLRASGVPR